MEKKIWFVLAMMYYSLTSICSFAQSTDETPIYSISKIENSNVIIDGNLQDSIWNQLKPINSFINPWSKIEPQYTELKMFYDSDNFYFCFNVIDTTLVCKYPVGDEMQVTEEDRVEMFFSKTKDLSSYYGFEMDPKGLVLDYQVAYYRKFNYDWNSQDLQIKTKLTDNGYYVEGFFSMDFIRQFMDKNQSIYWGAFRGDFQIINGKTIDKWYCLRNPNTKEPDFHLPAAMSKLIFQR